LPDMSRRCPIIKPGDFFPRSGWGGVLGILVLGAVFLGGCASSGVKEPFSLVPLKGEQAIFSREGLTLSIRPLEEKEGMEYLKARGFESFSEEIGDLTLISFLLKVDNQSGEKAVIDPSGTRFLTGYGPTMSLMTYAHLYSDLPPGPSREELLKGFDRISLDRMESVPPGGTLQRILLFRRPEKVAEEAGILFGSLYLGQKRVDQVLLSFKAISREE